MNVRSMLCQLSPLLNPFLGLESTVIFLLDNAEFPTPRSCLRNKVQGPSPSHGVRTPQTLA